MKEGAVRIDTPLREKRIAAVHRGAGPKGMKESKWESFDNFLLELAVRKGAQLTRRRVDDVGWNEGRPQIKIKNGIQVYDLVAIAVGVNSPALKLFEKFGNGYRAPQTTKTHIREFYLGPETIEKYLKSSMHVFLLDLPRLEFAALIPKGDYVTLCLLGRDIDNALVKSFLDAPEVKDCMPPDWHAPSEFCRCSPRINISAALNPFANRLVFIGDCGVTRLYKDGIGAAYRTAKAAAVTAVSHGISAEDFRRHYLPVCQKIDFDNRIGKLMFFMTEIQRRQRHDRRGILRMVVKEQKQARGPRRMSTVMWDLFTGSASYRDIFVRTLHPFFITRLVWEIVAAKLLSLHIISPPRARESFAGRAHHGRDVQTHSRDESGTGVRERRR